LLTELRESSDLSAGPVLDIIWTITLICPWDCSICCQDAVHVTRTGNQVLLRSDNLARPEALLFDRAGPNIFEQALRRRQEQGLELSLPEKIQVLEHLRGSRPKIDFSGGDPLIVSENLIVLDRASTIFGRHQVTLTATGAGLARYDLEEVAPRIGELNFTYDSTVTTTSDHRPSTYASSNLRRAASYAAHGVSVRAECPLTRHNISPANLTRLYRDLHEASIGTLLLMRLFPVGRGAARAEDMPSRGDYEVAIGTLRDLEAKYGQPRLRLQCALRYLEDGPTGKPNPCDLVRESFGLMPDGRLLASTWAIKSTGEPLGDEWILGNLARTPIAEILTSPRVERLRGRLDENYGQCKIFAFLNSTGPASLDRMFNRTDPLYSG
jgi:MoaA/NifB/PqqE/SkfB family radical SAM enzyme